jgi:Undecaprenyl-phosphate glucose phosphotransferase
MLGVLHSGPGKRPRGSGSTGQSLPMTSLQSRDLVEPTRVVSGGHFGRRPAGLSSRIERLQVQIVAIEYLSLAAVCLATRVIYFQIALTEWPPTFEYIAAIFLIPLLVIVPALGFRQYVAIHSQSRDGYLWGGVGAVSLAFALFLSLLFVFKIADWYSRGTFLCQFLSVSTIMLMIRASTHSYIRRAVRSGELEARKAILVGTVDHLSEMLSNLRDSGIKSAGILELPYEHDDSFPGQQEFSAKVRAFVDQCRALRPDDVIFLARSRDLPIIAILVEALAQLPVTVQVIPQEVHEFWGAAKIVNYGGAVAIKVLSPPLSNFELAVKRIFDVCAASLGLFLLSPLLALVSLAIKLDSQGPIFFVQNRHGYNNDTIPVIKFRTMRVLEDGETSATFTQAKANDSRITRLGEILRRTNIDELPQLFNVLRGEMSIVGPRPHPIALNKMFEDRIAPFSRRHNVKPGLTGWAQVNGFRGETDTIEKMQRRIEHDLYYIDHWSFLLDVKIVLMTLFSKSAYVNAA